MNGEFHRAISFIMNTYYVNNSGSLFDHPWRHQSKWMAKIHILGIIFELNIQIFVALKIGPVMTLIPLT